MGFLLLLLLKHTHTHTHIVILFLRTLQDCMFPTHRTYYIILNIPWSFDFKTLFFMGPGIFHREPHPHVSADQKWNQISHCTDQRTSSSI
jgi:hypothetical protein